MEMLDKGETDTFGHPHPLPTQVNVKPVAGKCILVSGHNLHDLEKILQQTEGKGINVYTNGEMLPAHGYPELNKKEFGDINGIPRLLDVGQCNDTYSAIQLVLALAQESDFDMAHFFQESFTPAEDNKQQVQLSLDASKATVMLYEPDFSVEKKVVQGSSLLELLENNGVPIIGACRAGVCGSCKCKVTKGKVNPTNTETLTAEEIEQGFVLACSSTVEGDLTMALG